MLSSDDIVKINNIAYQAGDEILRIYDSSFNIETKEDNSPLTTADRNSHLIIEKGLKALFPDIPILSEEGISIDYSERSDWEYFWLIDPLDGTKEFIKKNGEFTVNIAFIKNNKLFFGIIYAPKLKKTYVGTSKNTYKVINQKNFKKIIPKKKTI